MIHDLLTDGLLNGSPISLLTQGLWVPPSFGLEAAIVCNADISPALQVQKPIASTISGTLSIGSSLQVSKRLGVAISIDALVSASMATNLIGIDYGNPACGIYFEELPQSSIIATPSATCKVYYPQNLYGNPVCGIYLENLPQSSIIATPSATCKVYYPQNLYGNPACGIYLEDLPAAKLLTIPNLYDSPTCIIAYVPVPVSKIELEALGLLKIAYKETGFVIITKQA